MSLNGKSLTEIAQTDLRDLIDNKARENQTLEFKRARYGRSDEDIREMLRDICSMVNAFGGDLLFGVGEDEDGIAIDLAGIDGANEEAHRIVSSTLSNIDEHIPGLRTQLIPLDNGRSVLLIRVPKSHRGPHMITFKGLNQFWIRHDRQKSRMSTHEIRDACIKNEGLMEKLQGFLEKRKVKIRRDSLSYPTLVVFTTPLFLTDEIVDIGNSNIREILWNPPDQRIGGWNLRLERSPKPSLNGLIVSRDTIAVELFRNGHFELRLRSQETLLSQDRENKTRELNARPVIEYSVSTLRAAKAIYHNLSISEPIAIYLGLLNINGAMLKARPDSDPLFDGRNQWNENDLQIDDPMIVVDSLEHSDQAAKQLLDRVWNAFEFEHVPLFDVAGNFRPY